jgi:hypothetical protein
MAKVYVLIQTLDTEQLPVAVHAYASLEKAREVFLTIMDEDELNMFDEPDTIMSADTMEGDLAMTLVEVEVES